MPETLLETPPAEKIIEKIEGEPPIENQPEDTPPPAETPPAEAPPKEEVEISDEDFLKAANKRLGKEFKSIDELRPPAPELSDEEKKKNQSVEDLELIKRFVAKGGTPEQYNTIKQIANADPKEFSLQDTKRELKEAGLDDAEIDAVIKERYYQLSDEEKEELSVVDKSILKKHEIFSKKLENKSAYKIEQAKAVLSNLKAEIEAERYVAEVDAKISTTVEEIAKKMERKIKLDMGKSNDVQLNPVEFVIDEAHISEIKDILSDKAKREQFLYNQDGTENVENLFEALKWKSIAQSLAKKALVQGADEQVAFFQSKFPDNIQSVAPGNAPKSGKTAPTGKVIEGTEKTKFNASNDRRPINT